ncbi:LPS assembly protein LptD [Serratia microhaemolytica]|uniref:LPS assembly protein LptD n=1 Tax=Serratia microhaemolytica TaxID=2675110 RepID=UPI000FDF51B7|nr:LPS assembly protein LptD [Serratia microhaemolytica]
MKKSFPTLLATLVWAAIYSQQLQASLAEQCMIGVPVYDKPIITDDPDTLPVTVYSEQSQAEYPNNVLFTGNVHVEQGNSTLLAKQVELRQVNKLDQQQPLRTVTATGDVHYADHQIQLSGERAWSNLASKDTDVYQGDYQLVGRQGRGAAEKIKLRDQNRYTVLKEGSFTTCLAGDNSWLVVGSEVIYDREEEIIEIWNARFNIAGIPVFYSPYMQLPVGSNRRSGFLVPNARYGSINGFEFIQPYYWNIAPNFDATISARYMSRRGLQWQNEFRYLAAPGTGTLAFDWLPSDDLYAKDHASAGDNKRWLLYWDHSGVMNQVWRFNVDYTRVSDTYYFTDLNSQYGSTTDGYATQKLSVGYADQYWDLALSSKQFQVFSGAGNQNAYRSQPQLDINYYQTNLGPFDLQAYAQIARFTSVNSNNPETTRLHIEPAINLPLANDWGTLNTEVKVMATHFRQNVPQGFAADYAWRNPGREVPELDNSVNRVLPQFKTDGKVVFERSLDEAEGYMQTLEPRMQYLFVPYRDQSDIYTYDSTLLQSDYFGLFRDRAYSGLDRIASQNRLAFGVTSRIYDDALIERFNLSVGQIYYLNSSRTGEQRSNFDNGNETGTIVWAADTFWQMNQRWGLRAGAQYDPRLESVALGDAAVEYRQDENRMVQLNYRYASPEYISATLPTISNQGYQDGISQIGTMASWPVADRWALVGGYYYDTRAKQTANQLLALRYNTCCWAVNIGYERIITGWDSHRQFSQYDNKISLSAELRGLNNDHNLGSMGMLRSGILPYQRTF